MSHMRPLDLNIVKLAGPGRLPVPVEVEYVRDLEVADLELMATKPAGSVPSPIKRLSDRHHALARLLAGGVEEGEAALILGFDISRVSILKNSPAFQELLALYRSEVKREFTTVAQHMAGLSLDALLELRERLEQAPDRFTNNELMKLTTELVDRADTGPSDDVLPDVIELVAPDIAAE